MRRFIDLHIRAPEEPDGIQVMLGLAAKLGFRGLGLSQGETPHRDLKELAAGMGLDLVSRVDLIPRNTGELTAVLRRLRRRFEVVAVECRSKKIARQAAKDHRVDILSFPFSPSRRGRIGLDRQEASLASEANCVYEINLTDLLYLDPVDHSRLIGIMRREVGNARRFDVPIVVSSGARTPLQMRDPRGLAAVLTLMSLDDEVGLDAVSKNPERIVGTNRGKLDPGFVTPGVRRARGCR
jgi:ribonuclease P/MRP protein subunit RPP1